MTEKTELGVDSYRKLTALVRERISSKHYPVGSFLPSERELAEEFQINRRTVRRSLRMLEEQRILIPDSTRGRRVVQLPDAPVAHLALCFDDSLDQNDRLVHATGSSADIARGFHQRAQAEGRSTVTWLDVENTRLVMNGEAPRIPDISGIAIWPTIPCPPETLTKLHRLSKNFEIVLMDRRLVGFQSDFVGFDDQMIGRLAAERFAQFGYESYGFIGWAAAETVLHRLEGFVEGLAKNGYELNDDWTLLTRQDGAPVSQFHRFLQERRPRAIFCANDIIAVSLLLHLRDHGLRVPEDIALIGVGDSMGGLTDTLGLTSIALPHPKVGWDAADILLNRIRGDRANGLPPIERRNAVHLVVRRTCGVSTPISLIASERSSCD